MSTRNLVVMFGAMAALRRVDQEEPIVLLYSRIGYLAYVVFTAVIYYALHSRILSARDTTLITLPVPKKQPSISETWSKMREAADKAEREAEAKANATATDGDDASSTSTAVTDAPSAQTVATLPNSDSTESKADDAADKDAADDAEEEGKEEVVTVMEYDLRHLANARRSWATSTIFLAVVHYHMQSVNPLIMSCVMGITRLLTDDPLVQIHLRAAPAVDKLARPFASEKSPLATMLNELTPKEGEGAAAGSGTGADSGAGSGSGSATRAVGQSATAEELHDDGDDDDDDDEPPVPVVDQKDDHIKSDFDDEEDEAMKKEQ